MQPIRILFISPLGEIGGAEQCLLNVMESLREALPAAELQLLCATQGPLIERAAALGARARLLPMPQAMAALGDSILHRTRNPLAMAALAARALRVLPQTWRYVHALRNAVREIAPTLVHSNGLKTHLLTALAGLNGTPQVWHLHDFLGTRPAMGRALRWAARRASGAIAVSEAVARDARSVLPNLCIVTVYNAINVNHFTPQPNGDTSGNGGAMLDGLAGMAPAAAGTLRVGLVATFARWKGQDVLLEAAARFFRGTPAPPPARFYVIGGPIYQTRGSQFSEQDLRRRSAELGVADRVGFIGFQRDPCAIYRALDVVVHASTRPEPFGLTIAEAMACARPVLVSQSGGAAELFTPDHDAVGVPPGDAGALAAAIRALADDPDRRHHLARNAYQTALRRFSRDRLARDVLSAYLHFVPGLATALGQGVQD